MSETDFDLTRRETFHHWSPVTIRFSDQDSLQHINNVALSQYFEVSRTAFIYDVLRKAGPVAIETVEFILARVVIDFVSELKYPGRVDVGARITRLGNKSMNSGYAIFEGQRCIATSTAVNVFYDMNTRTSMVPPEDVREILFSEIETPTLPGEGPEAL
ncbi:MAG: thioesterase family protein [Pseudomonadota bacterium]